MSIFQKPPNGLRGRSAQTDRTTLSRSEGGLGQPEQGQPTQTGPSPEKPFDPRRIKKALGFDPDDPNVTVEQVPMDAMMEDAMARMENIFGGTGGPSKQDVGTTLNADEDTTGRVMEVTYEVVIEVLRALKKHAPMHSPHEGHSVILEEMEELWDEIKADRGLQASARKEAIQVAAMAVRYILDLDPK